MRTIKVVAAIITDGDKIYATQRGYGEFKDGWEFPGGKVEEGETSEEALVREIEEELEIEIKVDEYLTTIEYDYPAFHLSMDCFFCHIEEGAPTLNEHEAAKWLSGDQLELVDWLPADLSIMDEIKEKLSASNERSL